MKKIITLFSKKKYIMNNWKKIYLDHIKAISLVVLAMAIVLPVLILQVIQWINKLPWFFGGIAYLENGASVWLSFWGSYIGAIATILIALITLRLTLKNDISAKDNELNGLAIRFHRFEVEDVRLYDLTQCYPVGELEYFDGYIDGRYLIRIEFCEPFPPYFDIQVNGFKWGEIEGGEEGYRSMKFDAEYESNEHFVMFFLLDKNNDMRRINELYYINYFEPQVMSKKERRHRMLINLTCENKMYAVEHDKNENNIEFQIEIEVENVSDYQKDYVELRTTQRKLNYCGLVV